MLRSETYKAQRCEQAKRWRERYPEKVRAQRERRYQQLRDTENAAAKTRYAKNRVRAMWLSARKRAADKGLAFTIDVSDILAAWPSDGLCPALGLKLSEPDGLRQGPKWDSPSLDRVRPEVGYVPGNICVISWRANRIKCDATPEELARIGAWATKRTIVPVETLF